MLQNAAQNLEKPGPYEAPESSPGFAADKPHWGVLSISGGVIGCWLVLNELSYGAESLPHSMFPGLVVAAPESVSETRSGHRTRRAE